MSITLTLNGRYKANSFKPWMPASKDSSACYRNLVHLRFLFIVSFRKRRGISPPPTALLVILENATSTSASLTGANENRQPAASQGAALSLAT
ncbi:hypothetical protein J6590_078986 [Homalodisca vitripennis]|nr:hypothetical protein J6590_078986 [Homalodisca vitripennis]